MGLILDSSVLIAGERRRQTVKQVIQSVRAAHGDTESALSAISIIELTHGVYRARTDADKVRRKAFVDELARDMIVHPVSIGIAQLDGPAPLGKRGPAARPSHDRATGAIVPEPQPGRVRALLLAGAQTRHWRVCPLVNSAAFRADLTPRANGAAPA